MKELLDFMTALGTTNKPHYGKSTFIHYLFAIKEVIEGKINATIFFYYFRLPQGLVENTVC